MLAEGFQRPMARRPDAQERCFLFSIWRRILRIVMHQPLDRKCQGDDGSTCIPPSTGIITRRQGGNC
jgi:hypothetical protein